MNNPEVSVVQDALKQNLAAFNDKLIQQMRVYFSNDTFTPSPAKPSDTPHSNCPHLTSNPRFIDDIASTKRHSGTTNVSFLDSSRGHPAFGPSLAEACQILSSDFDPSNTRRWENTFTDSQSDPKPSQPSNGSPDQPDSSSQHNYPQTDFLTDEFSGKFESDSEQQAERTIELCLDHRADHFSFLSYAQSAATTFDGTSFFSLKSLIDKLEHRNLRFRRYECDQCHRKFYNPAALGGHKSKQHPKSSKRYNDRKNVYSLRTGERRKRTFLNNL